MPSIVRQFGRFRLDCDLCALTFDGIPVKIGRRATEILVALAESGGALVTKDDLISRVWRGVVVEENNIQVHVSALRKALDDCEQGQSYVLTVPGRGYRLVGLRPEDGVQGAEDGAMSAGPSLIVRPFSNMSGDPGEDYFADGLTEEIVSGLSRIRWLQVTARGSSLRIPGQPSGSVRENGGPQTRYVLEGSVRKAEGRVRVNTHLIRAIDSIHIWSKRYDLPVRNIFDLQDEIMTSVIGAIEPSLRQAEIDLVRRKRPENLDAYDCVLRALPFIYGMMADGADRAMPLLKKALELEPSYASAHAGLAWCHHFRYSRGGLREADRTAAIRHAHSALTFGSDDATTLSIAGLVIWFDEHDEAEAFDLFDRALAISKSNVFALFNSAVTLAWSGRFDTAMERGRQALQYSPFDPLRYLAYNAFAIVHFSEGEFEKAKEAARRGIEANPGFSVPHAYLSAAHVCLGDLEQARSAARDVLARDPGFRIEGFRQTVGRNPAVFGPFAHAWLQAGLPK